MFIVIKYMLSTVYVYTYNTFIVGKGFPILSISFLYPKVSFTSNFKKAREKRFFSGSTSNWFLYVKCKQKNSISINQVFSF